MLDVISRNAVRRACTCIIAVVVIPVWLRSDKVHVAVRQPDGDLVVALGGFDGVRPGMELTVVQPDDRSPMPRARVVRVKDRESVVRLVEEEAGRTLGGRVNVRFHEPLEPAGKVVIAVVGGPDEVRVDGTSYGDTTCLYLMQGSHKVQVVKHGHPPWGSHIDVAAGEAMEIRPEFPEPPRERQLVRLPGGAIVMGSARGARDERPLHRVSVGPFYIRACEVTCGEYWEFDASHRRRTRGGASHPADNLNWWDAALFCNWLSTRERLRPFYDEKGLKVRADTLVVDWSADGYRLPTEAEWEFACRAGTETAYYWGNSPDSQYLWYVENATSGTRPVATRLPNSFGLWDMSGNVAEWCNDWYGASYYATSPDTSPRGPAVGTYKAIRGGSWHFDAYGCRSAERFFLRPRDKFEDLGVRPVRPARE